MAASRNPLDRTRWTDAAWTAFLDGGLDVVRIDRLARGLGVSKGSFYWHFDSRDDLVREVLSRWEATATDDVIAAAGREPTPARRLQRLFEVVDGLAAGGRAELMLYLAAADDPTVSDFVERVTARRIAFVATELRELGADDPEGRARVALAVALGARLVHLAVPSAAPSGRGSESLAMSAFSALVVPAARSRH